MQPTSTHTPKRSDGATSRKRARRAFAASTCFVTFFVALFFRAFEPTPRSARPGKPARGAGACCRAAAAFRRRVVAAVFEGVLVFDRPLLVGAAGARVSRRVERARVAVDMGGGGGGGIGARAGGGRGGGGGGGGGLGGRGGGGRGRAGGRLSRSGGPRAAPAVAGAQAVSEGSGFFCAMRRRALRARGLAATSSSEAVMGFFVS